MAIDVHIRLPWPLEHQRPILLSGARYKVLDMGRRWGKTMLALMAALEGHGPGGLFRGAIDGGAVWVVAPSYPMANHIWRDLKRLLDGGWRDKSEMERRIELYGGGSVTVRSADNPDSLRGSGLDGVVIDEAAYMSEEVWTEALRPALSDRQGWAIFISTPAGYNWFWNLYERAKTQDGWECWQQPTTDNPLIDPAEIEAARLDLTSLAFDQEYLAQFVESGGQIVKRESILYWDEPPDDRLTVYAGVDLASSLKTTADYTAIATVGKVERTGELYLIDMWTGRTEQVEDELERHLGAFASLRAVALETVGYQQTTMYNLRRRGRLPLVEIPYRTKIAVKNRALGIDKDKGSRAAYIQSLFQRRKLFLPRTGLPIVDGISLEMELTAFPNGQHDDRMDALSFACAVADSYGARRDLAFAI